MLRLRTLVPVAALLVTTAACGVGGGGTPGGLSLDTNLEEVICHVFLEPAPDPCTAFWIVTVTNESDSETPAPDFSFLFGNGFVDKNDCNDPLGPNGSSSDSCIVAVGVSGDVGDSVQVLVSSGFLFASTEISIPD